MSNQKGYSKLAKFMANKIGHGMSEKCERHAEIADEYYQERIAELESGVKAKDARTLERINRIERQEEEIKALKAQVEGFREELGNWIAQHGCVCCHPACNRCKDTQDSVDLLKKSPKQCLSIVKADAVECAIEYAKQFGSEHLLLDVETYAQQLRDNAK